MTLHRTQRFALALIERCLPPNEPLTGDLIEEVAAGRSSWWLWRQILGAVVYQRVASWPPSRVEIEFRIAGAALLVLLSFEAVFVTNVAYRLAFGPPSQDITAFAYFFDSVSRGSHIPSPPSLLATLAACVMGLAVAAPLGWVLERVHDRHVRWSVAVFSIALLGWAIVNLGSPFAVQLFSMASFVGGLLIAGRLSGGARRPQTVDLGF